MNNRLYTIQEAANLLGVSTKTLRRWDQRGRLVATRTIGNQRRYTQSQIDKFRSSTKNAAEVAPLFSETEAPRELKATHALPSALSGLPSGSFLKNHFLLRRKGEVSVSAELKESLLGRDAGLGEPHEPASLARSHLARLNPFKIGFVFASLVLILSLAGAFVLTKYNVVAGLAEKKDQFAKFIENLPQISLQIKSRDINRDLSFVPQDIVGGVLAAAAGGSDLALNINIPTFFSQNVGIGTAATDASAILDLVSEEKGFLAPRMTQVQIDAIPTPAAGLFVYNTDTNHYNMYDGTSWQGVFSSIGDSTTGEAFTETGTSGTALYFYDADGRGKLTTANLSGARIYTLPDAGGEVSLLGQTISNSELVNPKVTVSAGTNLTGGGEVSLGSSVTLTLKDSIDLSGTLIVGGATTLKGAVAITGALTANGNVTLGDAVGDTITFTGRVAQDSDLIPITATGTSDLGTSSLPWDNVYADNLFAASSGTSGYWQRTSSSLSPTNITDDLLLGATSTSSAKFAFINIAGGTPTATISANSGNNSTTLTGLGVLGTTNMQTLTLGNSTTGNIVIDSGSSAITLSDDVTASGDIAVNGGDITTSATTFNLVNATATTVNFAGAATTLTMGATTGTATIRNATLDLPNGSATASGNLTLYGAARSIQTTARQTLTLGGTTTGEIELAPGGTTVLTARAGGVVFNENSGDVDFRIESDTNANLLVIDAGLNNITLGAAAPASAVHFLSINPTITLATADNRGIMLSPNITETAGSQAGGTFRHVQVSGTLTTAAEGGATTITSVNTLAVHEPNITLGTNTSITNAVTLHIESAPTEATNNYGLWVEAGTSRFDANVQINNGSATIVHAIRPAGETVFNEQGADIDFRVEGDTNTTLLFVDASADVVGIGNNIPLTALDVTGSASLSANISLRGAGTAHTFNILDNGTLNIRRSPGGDAGVASIFFLGNNGNVGINTATPALRLDVQDSQAATGAAQIFNTATGTDADGLIVKLGNTSTTAVNNANHFISFETSGIGIVGSVRGSGGTGVQFQTSGIADFAEYFKKDQSQTIQYGSVVCLNSSGLVVLCDNTNGKILGVASEKPAFLGGENLGDRSIAVGLVGMVETFVSTASGEILPGDALTASSIPGVAVKATKAGQIVGKAVEGFDGNTSEVCRGRNTTSEVEVPCGKILVSVNISWHDPSIYIASDGSLGGALPDATSTTELALQGETLQAQIASTSASLAGQTDYVLANDTLFKSLQDKVSALEARLDLLNLQFDQQASTSGLLASQGLTLRGWEASTSAALALGDVELNNATISEDLMVLGRATVTDLGVTGNINAGMLSIHGLAGEINTLSGALYLQKDGLGGVNILAGKVIIDTSGNMTVAGTITANAVEAKNYTVLGQESIGSATIPAGSTSIEVSTLIASQSSKIFLTTTSLTDKQITVVQKSDGKFTVAIPQPTTSPISFDWWIVGNKN